MKEWIREDDYNWAGGGYIKCPYCGYGFSYRYYGYLEHHKYCPECGKRVKGQHECEEVDEDE